MLVVDPDSNMVVVAVVVDAVTMAVCEQGNQHASLAHGGFSGIIIVVVAGGDGLMVVKQRRARTKSIFQVRKNEKRSQRKEEKHPKRKRRTPTRRGGKVGGGLPMAAQGICWRKGEST